MYRTRTVRIREHDSLFGYFDEMSRRANNLYNAARFRERQIFSGVGKDPADRTDHEKAIFAELEQALLAKGKSLSAMPTKEHAFIGYAYLQDWLRAAQNPDFFAEGLPRQTAQQILKHSVKDMKAFFSALRAYKRNPSKFTGRPKLPGYAHKGGRHEFAITNQDAHFVEENGQTVLKLPLTKIRLSIGAVDGARLKEVHVVPDGNTFRVCAVLEDAQDVPETPNVSSRIAAIDMGVENLMAVSNNCGLPGLLYKGGAAKSANRMYNKHIAKIMSEQTLRTKKAFVPDQAYYNCTTKRNDRISDILHKTAKHFVTWCVEHRIDTIVIGWNNQIKKSSTMDRQNNQNFVQLPHQKLAWYITYRAERYVIRVIKQEESYTSKASFLDWDDIPVYHKNDKKTYAFSGHRKPARYKGMYKKDGFRGLYKTADGQVINSDLNGSANILRKAFPHAFDHTGFDFNQVWIIRHPEKPIIKRSA